MPILDEVRITELPGADPLAGLELIPLVQSGVTKTRSAQNLVLEGGLQDHLDDADPHTQYADQATTYTETEVDGLLDNKAAIAGQTFTGDIAAPGITATGPFTSLGIDDNATSTAITIDASENVGIGTLSPQVQLDISSNTGGIIRLSDSTSSTNANDLIGRVEFYTNDSNGHRIGAYIQSTNQEYYGRKSDLRFGVTKNYNANATEAMRIRESGNVGIGTTSPTEKLDVDGSIRASTGILFGTDTAAANTLDDYETGTWTATASGQLNMSGVSINVEEYTKIGNMVFAQIRGTFSVTSGAGVRTLFEVTLPFLQDGVFAGGGGVRSPSNLQLNPSIDDPSSGSAVTVRLSFISYESGIHHFNIGIQYRGA